MLRYKRPGQTYSAAKIAEKLKIAGALRDQGKRVYEIARVLGVTDTTYYNWMRRANSTGNVEASELRRLRQENAKLRRAVKSLAGLAGRDAAEAVKS
ncbi:hypothetical protein BH10PSE7_BH10PSE7_16710 [soil metagenome]